MKHNKVKVRKVKRKYSTVKKYNANHIGTWRAYRKGKTIKVHAIPSETLPRRPKPLNDIDVVKTD